MGHGLRNGVEQMFSGRCDGGRCKALRGATDAYGIGGTSANVQTPVIDQIDFCCDGTGIRRHILRLRPVNAEHIVAATDGAGEGTTGSHVPSPP